MKRSQQILLGLSALAIFALIYSIHLDYHLPYHIDEWHHINEAVRLGNYGEYFDVLKSVQANRFSGIEIGFHFFLFLLSFIVNLVSAYEFLPAIWAVLSALTLFFVVYKKTDNNFWISWLAMAFFASIKSNVNITGLWFFTPLTFSLPFIFLYFYFFSEGIEKNNNKYLLISLAIMLLLLPTHSISVIFALPALLIYCLISIKKIAKRPWIFALFAAMAAVGLLFYKFILSLGWNEVAGHLLSSLQFPVGWGVIEAKLPMTEVYGWFGYLAALLGLTAIILRKEIGRYSIYLIWPVTVFIMIIAYLITGVSYLSPYQRNLYYFAIALPILSAMGIYYSLDWIWGRLIKLRLNEKTLTLTRYAIVAIGSMAMLFFLFADYFDVPKQFALYQALTKDDRQILDYLAIQPRSTVMAAPLISTTLFSYAHKDPVGDLSFYGNPREVMNFYLSDDCAKQENIIKYFAVKYIISPFEIKCYFVKLIKSNSSDYLYLVE